MLPARQDQNDLKQALNYAKEMLKELKTASLSPRNYYDLYMKVLDELRYLEDFFMSLQRNGKPVSELYEQVQSCSMVLPRLYLLVTVGSVYIKSRQAPAKDILKDLVEMAKGVQHPMRGLFLRNYLAHVARDKLPDVGSEYAENGGGTVQDSLDFIIQNFSETNRLWVRMQNQVCPLAPPPPPQRALIFPDSPRVRCATRRRERRSARTSAFLWVRTSCG